jgi:hypothetical protein
VDPSEAILPVRSRLRGIKGNNFVTIERLKQERLFKSPELRWDAGENCLKSLIVQNDKNLIVQNDKNFV